MGVDCKFTDNSQKVLKKLEIGVDRAAIAIGMEGERFGKTDPDMPVDTGRARNSITWATNKRQNTTYSYQDDHQKSYTEHIGGGAKRGEVYLGSNVEYFPGIEGGGPHMRARHILRKAVTTHGERFKQLTVDSFKKG